MQRRSDLGVAVIGCGHWGSNYVRLLHALGVRRLVACDVDVRKLDALARQFSGILVEADRRRVLDSAEVHAVIVATTANTHFEIARDAFLAGKDVLVEKPLTLNALDGAELVRLARAGGRVLMVGHTFLYNPAVRMMRDLISRGEAGSVYYVQANRTHLGLVRRDVNAVWDLATHDISIFGYLLGAFPESVSATGGRYLSTENEDVATITLRYPGGVLGTVFVSWVDSNKMRQVAVIGSRARIVFDDLNNLERLRIFEKGLSIDRPYAGFGEFQLLVRDGDIRSPRLDTTEPLRLMAEHFLDCVTAGKEPLTGGESGLDVVAVLEAIDVSMRARGAPVAVARPSVS